MVTYDLDVATMVWKGFFRGYLHLGEMGWVVFRVDLNWRAGRQ